ncbi:ABC transporter permease [Romboutsia maritimum]|nr:ABC transporter permease [Romboutsia maritimum]
MIENNNKKVINKLAKESFKSNKGRNKFAVISIILTTLLFTAFFTIQISILKSNEYSTMRMIGSTFHGGFGSLTTKEYEKIKDNRLIKEKGIAIQVGLAQNEELAKRQTEIKYGDVRYINNCFAKPIKGNIPQNKNEILIDKITLDELGLPYEINQKINITYNIDENKYKKDFIVSGIYEGDIVSSASVIYLSKDFIESELKDINQEQSKKTYWATGLIDLEVNFSNSFFIENKLEKVLKESGYSVDDIKIGMNHAYVGGRFDNSIESMLGVIGFLGIIMLSGYLIIYNIFYISIVKDIKFYGLLKTIGTTKKQIKKIIIKQALTLCLIGIPIGLILGYSAGAILMPVVMNSMNIEYTKISINPIIFIISILFSLITVLISLYKPLKVASKVSPVEATRYSGVNEKYNKKIKRSSHGARLRNMALSNILKNKKKALVVISSLSISIILLNMVYTIANGFDKDKYLSTMIGTDFTIGDASFYRWRYNANEKNALTQELCNKIEKLKGIKSVDKMYYRELKIPLTDVMSKNLDKKKNKLPEKTLRDVNYIQEDKEISAGYYGVDENIYELFKNYLPKGELDINKFKSGNYIIITECYETGNIVNVGDKVTIPFENGKIKEYEVLAISKQMPLYLYVGYSFTGIIGYIPSEEFKKTTSNDSIMTAMFNVDKKSLNTVKSFLDKEIEKNPSLDYRSKSTYENEFKDMNKSNEIVGYGLSLMVGIIGILNFDNVMITSITSRKKELSMLKSIGMTKDQIRKMLVLEGLYYVFATIGIVITIGLPITYILASRFEKISWMFTYKFTVIPLLLTVPILLLIAILIPVVCFKQVSKNSIVEALREV